MSTQNEKPIIFNSEMVRAILNGKKTQTRRVIKPQPEILNESSFGFPVSQYNKATNLKGNLWRYKTGKYRPHKNSASRQVISKPFSCPYGQVGDKLYVREAYRVCNMDIYRDQALMIHYYSDRVYKSVVVTNAEMKLWKARKKPFMKTPGRFMYKSLARIWLEITNIRVERVQDISESDCYKEGAIDPKLIPCSPYEIFAELWKSIYPGSWEVNPWVWVVEFKKINNE